LRVVFLGSPSFAVPSLISLAHHEKIEIRLVVTQPDRPAGRGRTLAAPPVKHEALRLGLPVYQPESLRADADVQPVRDACPDVIVVVSYGELLRRNVLQLAPYGCLNVHPSALPKYRGAAPIQAAILNGDPSTAVSIIKLVRRLDAGPVIGRTPVDIMPEDTTGTLSARLADIAATMLPGVALAWVAGELTETPQDDGNATYTREWTTADARIDWRQPAIQIERLIRAANPWPIAWTVLGAERVRILAASVVPDPETRPGTPHEPGTIMGCAADVIVLAADGALQLETVQPAGKRSMPAPDWLRGVRREQPRFEVMGDPTPSRW
jgi:methionyl-tRNA formyltransferase